MFENTYSSLSDALAAFRGIKGNHFGRIKINDVMASSMTNGFYENIILANINTENLTIEACPKISSYLLPFSNLVNKTVIWEGDSIAQDNEYGYSAWRKRIEPAYSAIGVNYSLGGSTFTGNLDGVPVTSVISSRIDTDVVNTPSCEYFIFDGGTNDADRIGQIVQWVSGSGDTKVERKNRYNFPAKFGTWNDTDFSGNYDKNTFCGSLEYVIWKVLTSYKGVKIGYIVAPKMGSSSGLSYYNRLEYFREAMDICKKWGVPYINLWEDSFMNPNMPNQYDSTKTKQQNVDAGSALFVIS
jgi:hypothetical protein